MFQDKKRISTYQAVMLVISSAIGNVFAIMSVFLVKDAGRDGWLSLILAYAIGMIIGLILIKLGSYFPNKTLVQYLPDVLGKFLGKSIGLIWILSFWLLTAIVHRENAEIIKFFMPQISSSSIIIMTVLLNIYILKKGFKIFARIAELLIPMMIISILLGIFFIIPEMELKRLTPIIEMGFSPVLKGIPRQLAFVMQTILFMGFWFPRLNNKKKGTSIFLAGLSISGILLTSLVVATIAVLGPKLIVKLTVPALYLFHGTIFIVFWVISTFVQTLVFFYPSVIGLAQWLNLKDYKFLILPMSIITVTLALLPSSFMEVLDLNNLDNLLIVLPLGLLIPIIWFIAIIRGFSKS
ncbi:GerAB/ArcD/ProY family transporter [Halanaerobaculum tunisiense]